MSQLLGFVLGACGAFGLWLAGRGSWRGWAFNLAIQPVWVTFSIIVHAYALAASSLLYAGVYMKNLQNWKKSS